jgi:hypothetical protein
VQQIRGYTLLETVLKKAPQAHILTTKGVGTLTINAPLLKALNTYLLRSKDMTWQSFWGKPRPHLGGTRGVWTMCPRTRMLALFF